MVKNSYNPNFEQTIAALRAHSFEVTGSTGGGMLVSKHGAAAVLVAAQSAEAPAAFAERPGFVICGEVARLLDRGYQKFLKTHHFEIPATSSQLSAIHQFSEELKQAIGAISLYNESLGTTSDLYQYDRLKGREAPQATLHSPWQSSDGH